MSVEQLVQMVEEVTAEELGLLDKWIAEHENKLATLYQLRKVLRVRLGLEEPDTEPAPKRRGRKPGPRKGERGGIKLEDTVRAIPQEQKDNLFDEKPNPDRERIYDLLVQEGSMPVSVIAKKLGFTWQKTRQLIELSDWFVKVGRDTEDSEADIEIANLQRLRNPAPNMNPSDGPRVGQASEFSQAPKGKRLVSSS